MSQENTVRSSGEALSTVPSTPKNQRNKDYGYLDEQGQIYLDYTGAGLASRSQLDAHHSRLTNYTSGNPHSINPTSQIANDLVAKTRTRVLEFLNACPREYAVIFTANATGAARLVGEAYAFGRHSRFVLTADNHNSINGLRRYAERAKARTDYISIQTDGDMRTSSADVKAALRPRRMGCLFKDSCRSLFAYPAQSNFTGVTHPLCWVKLAQDRGYDVLLDAAAYLPTSDIDLSQIKPEFVIVSWYKLFGFPTGVGSLVVRRDALATLNRPWFSGGTVQAALVGVKWHMLNDDETAFEDGTLNFLSIPDVHFGIDWLLQLGREATAARVRWLTERFIRSLHALRHTNGKPMAVIYGPTDMKSRGGTIAFNLLDAEGNIIDGDIVARDSAAARISIRTGCFCNPGAGETALKIPQKQVQAFFNRRRAAAGDGTHRGPLASAIRASFGVASIEEDGDALMQLIESVYRDWVPISRRSDVNNGPKEGL